MVSIMAMHMNLSKWNGRESENRNNPGHLPIRWKPSPQAKHRQNFPQRIFQSIQVERKVLNKGKARSTSQLQRTNSDKKENAICTYHFPFCSQLKKFRTYHTKFIKKSASMHYELSESSEVMKLVNDLVKAPEMADGLIEKFVNDLIDTALDTEDIEEKIDEEVDKVSTAIAGGTAAQLPEAMRKQKVKQSAQTIKLLQKRRSGSRGCHDEEELEEVRACLAEVRSLVPIFLLFHTLTAQEAGKGGANST
ncbi:hypothetical protein ACJRO7_013591 [Eucalyptus globulus]|uniref:Uncharacterized protein n=1 Tax=Eucalyptus globulus TaxID=34317 RepID=A0ABD3KX87_EUCGL